MGSPRLLLAGLVIAVVGCGGGNPRIEAPALDPERATAQVFDEYDKNKDGYLDAREAEACPSIKSAFKRLDKDRDGKISRDEMLARFDDYQASRVGLYVTTVKVQMDGKPLAGASVELVPESFMGSGIKPASGTTDDSGRAMPRVEGSDVPGCSFGFYRVRISKKDASDREAIPARYQNSLGTEIPNPEAGAIIINLTSK